jgi:hypothetical protein
MAPVLDDARGDDTSKDARARSVTERQRASLDHT